MYLYAITDAKTVGNYEISKILLVSFRNARSHHTKDFKKRN